MHGQGKFISKNGLVYQGKFIEGYPSNSGVVNFPNGEKYEG